MSQIKKRVSATVSTPNRLEALTDAVFAIVMTLLVLEIAVPEIARSSLQAELPQRLVALWPSLLSYVMSFILLGLFWAGHRFAFHYIKRCDTRLIWINIFYLMFIALLPFTTSLHAHYLMEQIPLVIYLINIAVVLIMRFILFTYATGNYRLVDSDIDPRLVKRERLTTLVFSLVLLLGIGVTFISTAAVWYAMWGLLVFAFVTGGGQPRHR